MPFIQRPALLICGLLLAAIAHAAAPPPAPAAGDMPPSDDPQPAGHAPPPEAFAACAGQHPGDQVLLRLPGQAIKARCVDFQGRLAARPEQPPPPRQ